jgi:hypothetical protein
MGGVVHHDREGEAKGKGREEGEETGIRGAA